MSCKVLFEVSQRNFENSADQKKISFKSPSYVVNNYHFYDLDILFTYYIHCFRNTRINQDCGYNFL